MRKVFLFIFLAILGSTVWAKGFSADISFGLIYGDFFTKDLPYDLSGSIGLQLQKELLENIYFGVDGAFLVSHSKDDEFNGDAYDYPCPHSDFSNYAFNVIGIGLSGIVTIGYKISTTWLISGGAGVCWYNDSYYQIVESNATGWLYNNGNVSNKTYILPDAEIKIVYKVKNPITFSFGYSIIKGFMYGIGLLI